MGRHNGDNAPEPQSELNGGDTPTVSTPTERNEAGNTTPSRGITASFRRLDSAIDRRSTLTLGVVIVLVLALFAGLVQHRRSQVPVYPDYQGAGSGPRFGRGGTGRYRCLSRTKARVDGSREV